VSDLFLRSAGLVTSLGSDVDSTIASMRAGFDAFRIVPYQDLGGNDMQASPIVGFADGLGGLPRYLALAERSFEECLRDAHPLRREEVALVVGLPQESRPGAPPELAAVLSERLARLLRIPRGAVLVLPHGRVSTFHGLLRARELLSTGRFSACIVGGIDVLTNGASLSGIAAARKGKEEPDSIIPGEAAAFICVSAAAGPSRWGDECSRVAGIGIANEPATGTAQDPIIGKGLNRALKAAMQEAGLPDVAVHVHINDVNGSRIEFEDDAMALARFFRSPHHEYHVWHVASHLGETGAACGAVELIWAQAAIELGFGPGTGALLSTSQGDRRAAAFVQGAAQLRASSSTRRRASVGHAVRHIVAPSTDPPVTRDRGLRLAGEDARRDLLWQHQRELAWLWSVREEHFNTGAIAWNDIGTYEERILAHADALAWADGTGLAHAEQQLRSEDPHDVTAGAFVLLCTADRSSSFVDAVLDPDAASPLHRRALANLLLHLPADSASLLARCVDDTAVELATSALTALALRQQLAPNWLEGALRSSNAAVADAAVRAAAIAGTSSARAAVAEMLSRRSAPVASPMTRIALLALGFAAHEIPELAVDAMAESTPIGCALLCLRDRRPFVRWFDEGRSSAASFEACGWSGELELVPRLLAALSHGDRHCANAAARSLAFITGVQCGEAGTETTGRRVPELSLDPDLWRRELSRADVLDHRAPRLRHGLPWTSDSALATLARRDCDHRERLIGCWEWAVVHGQGLPMHPDQFVSEQARRLADVARTRRGTGVMA